MSPIGWLQRPTRIVWEMIRELGAEGALGPVVACLPLIALVSWLLIPNVWRKPGRVVPGAIRAELTALGVGWLCAGALIGGARGKFIRSSLGLDPEDPSVKARWIAAYVALDFDAQFMVGAATLIAVPPLAAIIASRWARELRRSGESARSAVSVVVSVAGLLCATGISLCRHVLDKDWSGCGLSVRDRYDMMLSSFDALPQGRWVAVAGAMTCVALVVTIGLLRPAPTETSRRVWLVVGMGTLLLGGAAWAATRGHASDARHPLSLVDPRIDVPWQDSELPPAGACFVPVDAPMLVVSRKGVMVDGMTAATPSEVEQRLIEKRKLWEMLNPGKAFPGVVLVAAPSDIPMQQMTPMLLSARSAAFVHAQVLLAYPLQYAATRTLGKVQRNRDYCAVALPANEVLSEAGTWGELARRMRRKQRKRRHTHRQRSRC